MHNAQTMCRGTVLYECTLHRFWKYTYRNTVYRFTIQKYFDYRSQNVYVMLYSSSPSINVLNVAQPMSVPSLRLNFHSSIQKCFKSSLFGCSVFRKNNNPKYASCAQLTCCDKLPSWAMKMKIRRNLHISLMRYTRGAIGLQILKSKI